VLALWLLLGMGVDYGIFLVEHPADDGEAWLAIGLGAVSTLLSFGLLAVSTTPAIHAFGTTLGVGVTLVWLLSPLSAPRDVRAR
jgi:predicted exporter